MVSRSQLKFESRYRAIILGGGIHGVGVAHDLGSRGWKDVLVVEKSTIGAGTSSKSTKLIHGGLRYLQHPRDFPLVAEGLEERANLIRLAPDLVHPLPFIFPVLKDGGMPRFMIKSGLWLYDFLAMGRSLGQHKWVASHDVMSEVPILNADRFKGFYRFYDGQTDDLALVRRVSSSAERLGVCVAEQTQAETIQHTSAGWMIRLHSGGEHFDVAAKYVVNALGPWANVFLQNSAITPRVEGINNQGSHILLRDFGLKSGLFLQSPKDGRIFFVLPWQGYTLIGTTERDFNGPPDDCKINQDEISYLLAHCNEYLSIKIGEGDIIASYSGLRWLAKDPKSGLSDTSRSDLITEHGVGSDVLYTIYGGKLTAYRALARDVGDRIVSAFGDRAPSKTNDISFWLPPSDHEPHEDIINRFLPGNVPRRG